MSRRFGRPLTRAAKCKHSTPKSSASLPPLHKMAEISTYIPLSQREQWAGVEPIAQDDGPNPLVAIMYAQEYRDAMDYFRAVIAADEHSERVLELTETIIRMNPAHYTIWQWRMDTLIQLKKDLSKELDLMNQFAKDNLKSYQVWHHRLQLMSLISPDDPQSEINFIHDTLIPDAKNYHTWAYLHWIYTHFAGLGRVNEAAWDAELRWCEELLRVDGRNNSAWGWRWHLRMVRPGSTGADDHGKEEIEYTLRAIHLIPHNASAWNYLRGLLKHLKLPFTPVVASIMPYTDRDDEITAEAHYSPPPASLPADTPVPVSYALEYLAEALLEQGKKQEAASVYDQLGQEVDRIRAAYWAFRKGQVEA